MNTVPNIIAAMSALDLSVTAATGAPDWVHLLPSGAGGRIDTNDRRGPYMLADQAALITRSLPEGEKLPIDENHATDKGAKTGAPAPAVGWIVALQSRADGIWGKVEWTKRGRELVQDRAYRAISPVITHDEEKTLHRLLRASLVNTPNLRGLVALHAEEPEMSFTQKLAKTLGLKDDATEEAILSAVGKIGGNVATQSQLDEIGTVLGVEAGGDTAALVTAAQSMAATADGDADTIKALQSSIKDMGATLKTLTEGGKRKAAESFIDDAMKEGRAGLNQTVRDKYIALHMENPERTEDLIGAMPVLGGALITTGAPKDGKTVALNAEQLQVAAMLGQSPEDYAKILKEDEGQ
ncbi:phage protease [Thalassococcus sp. S3]|uniref:phage protease n=1 Tax=Thalassococcus sp. S3 TaxID=2017482 RepID=UPI0010245F73|nr:phage protease [Thalassococcus sp. S3]QBF31501.1 hypothetical protein CFI11_09770 [Thalassococcus sp. S3]